MPPKVPPAIHSLSSRDELFIDEIPFNGGTVLQKVKDEERRDGNGVLSNHKGKLAVGVAAMLGIAVYYKWREHLLAKEDPEEYRRLKRITAGVETGESEPGRKA